MKQWIGPSIAIIVLILLAMTAGLWLSPLLDFVGANTDVIQGLTDLIQLGLWIVAGLIFVFGFWRSRRPGETDTDTPAPFQIIEASEQSAVATQGGIAAGQIAVGRDVQGDVILVADPDGLWEIIRSRRPEPDLRKSTEEYLTYVVDRYRYLDFRGMGVSDRVPLSLPLVDLFVPLKARIELPEGETWARDLYVGGRRLTDEEAETVGRRLSEPLPTLQLLQEHDGLIVLGDPGAGKTTFLKYLALYLATGRGTDLGFETRIPFLLPLSAYANRLSESSSNVPLGRFIADYYEERGVDLAVGAMLEEALARGGALLLLDGLDEVKDQGQRRIVVDSVVDFFARHRRKGNKFVLTSRIVGYREVRPVVEGLAECTLVDFDQEEIETFIDRWTRALEQAARGRTVVAAQEAEQEKTELLEAVARNPGVRRLASNPLLLTILTLMKRQGVTLPERRVELYDNYVATLLKHWNLARGLGRPASRDLDVVETLKVLAPLALWMHETSPGVGLVKQEDLRRRLETIYTARGMDDPEQSTILFLEDVHDHAGLLVERGAREYGFIHLTFQEYLAAVAIAQQAQQSIEPMVATLSVHVGDDSWHEVSLLAIGYLGLIQQRDEAAGAVLQGLIAEAPGEPGEAVILAGECVLDVWPGGVTPTCRKTAITALLATMRDDEDVSAVHRAQAGRVLSTLGDPRVEVLDPLQIEWCEVPVGSFKMGDDLSDYDIPYAYRLSRYPITNGQYLAFVDAGGYATPVYWLEAAEVGLWKAGQFKGRFDDEPRAMPTILGEPFNLSNHPVVSVSWYEALAFVRWLNDQLRSRGTLPDGWEVRLPNEPEWEKAARGVDGRDFPWVGDATTNHANYNKAGIESTNAVGCFPAGVSPYGIEEMSGNVLEWTNSVHDDLPYPVGGQKKAQREALGSTEARVLRGGSFNYNEFSLRCAARDWYNPSYFNVNFGFRVCAAPISPGQ